MEERIKHLVAKYITRQSDEFESEEVKNWINANKENEAYYIHLYSIWQDSLLIDSSIIDADNAYALFQNKLAEKRNSRRLYTWYSGAAAAAVLLIMFTFCFNYDRLFNSDGLKQDYVELMVPKGTTKNITLPDGTTVWLNAGSFIRYNKDFSKTSRTVFLDGEAYFDITENKFNIPFIVKTKRFTIRDIGTVFNVKAYSGDTKFETAVIEGEVSVEDRLTKVAGMNKIVFVKQEQVLKINQSVHLKTKNGGLRSSGTVESVEVIEIDPSHIDFYNGWKDNLLVFEEIGFGEVMKILERKYDVEIVITDESLYNYNYTGSFKGIKDIHKALNLIKETTPVSYTITGREILIKKKVTH